MDTLCGASPSPPRWAPQGSPIALRFPWLCVLTRFFACDLDIVAAWFGPATPQGTGTTGGSRGRALTKLADVSVSGSAALVIPVEGG